MIDRFLCVEKDAAAMVDSLRGQTAQQHLRRFKLRIVGSDTMKLIVQAQLPVIFMAEMMRQGLARIRSTCRK